MRSVGPVNPATALLWASALAALAPQAARMPARLLSGPLDPAPWNLAQAGGIAACEAVLDERGGVTRTDVVQDVAPYGAMLADAVRSWRFEPAREGGRAVASRMLVLGFFRPPSLTFAAPETPRYKSTAAPEELPWPTSVTVPPYPPNALGSGKVLLEAEVSEAGAVTSTRRLSPAGAFDDAAVQTVNAWRFRPARHLGREVPSRVVLILSFIGTTP